MNKKFVAARIEASVNLASLVSWAEAHGLRIVAHDGSLVIEPKLNHTPRRERDKVDPTQAQAGQS
ncbi:MAG: hypothetical protein H7842_02480 [Gammaproteobacteria bacterium SHHR-1]